MDTKKVECHQCKLMRGRNLSIMCSKKECQSYFCLFCFEEKYGIGSYSTFLKEQSNHKWKCFKCRKVCNCENCLNEINLNILRENALLKKKRFRFRKNLHKVENVKKKNLFNYESDFPNLKRNKNINKIIIRSAIIIHLIKIFKIKKFSNKPCLVCNKFKCPKNVEVLKFKSIDEVKYFLETFYKEYEEEIKRNFINEELSKKILEQKKNLDKVKEILQKIPFGERLKVPKRICSNCLSNLLLEQNGLFIFSNLLKEEDEAAKLTIKQKLEIINGLHNLILKEKKKKKINTSLKNLIKKDNINEMNSINIFNSILNNTNICEPIKPELKIQQNYFNNNHNFYNNNNFFQIQEKDYFHNNPNININMFKDFDLRENVLRSIINENEFNFNSWNYNNNKNYIYNNNIYTFLLNKISFTASETNNLLFVIQKKLYEYMTNKNDGISNEICLINELLKLKSDSIKNSLFDYNRELQNLQNYFSINQEKMV